MEYKKVNGPGRLRACSGSEADDDAIKRMNRDINDLKDSSDDSPERGFAGGFTSEESDDDNIDA